MRSSRNPRPPRAPREPRAPRSRLPAPGSAPRVQSVLARPRANRPLSELVMIANGTLPRPVDLTDADERTIEEVLKEKSLSLDAKRKGKS